MFIYFGKTWLWCAFFKEKSLLAEMGCLRLKFRKRKSKTLTVSGQWSDAGCMGDVLLRTGVEKHQEFLPTSTCCCFVLKSFLVLESGYLTWCVGALLFLWKLVSCCQAKHLLSDEWVSLLWVCVLPVTVIWSLLCHWQLWMAPEPDPGDCSYTHPC